MLHFQMNGSTVIFLLLYLLFLTPFAEELECSVFAAAAAAVFDILLWAIVMPSS